MLYTQKDTPVNTNKPKFKLGDMVNYQGTCGKVLVIYDKLDQDFYTIVTKDKEVYTTVERYLSHHIS